MVAGILSVLAGGSSPFIAIRNGCAAFVATVTPIISIMAIF
jgi:hypothetical protein